MSSESKFKIIVVGGGIAGLTLASMLEKFDIEYVLLEAHDKIAPPVGASIGLMPNGLFILDQLGCYDAVRAVSQARENDWHHIRASDGKPLICAKHVFTHLEKRHGYPMLFLDRQWLLQVLYEQIQHKDRILLQKRVQKIDNGRLGVHVTTTDGHTYSGDMVVGADGIHSTVRREMFRLASEIDPGYFPPDEEDRIPCYYNCNFGISQHVDGWPQGELCFTTGDGRSFLVASGPENRVYWFLFVKLPRVLFGKKIPTYTKEDETLFAREHKALRITELINFGDVYDKRITSTLTPLHEMVFEKWFFRRSVLIGDSAHKPNPIGGVGGNAALESVAEFINALLEKQDQRQDGLNGLSTDEVTAVCQQFQNARHERAIYIVSRSHDLQALFAFENPFISNLFLNIVAPLAGDESSLERIGEPILGGSRVKKLSIPFRPRVIPFHHELPVQPLRSSLAEIPRVLTTILMGTVFFISLKDPTPGPNPTCGIHFAYFLSQTMSPLLVYTVEGYRLGNQGTLLAFPSLFLFGAQMQTICRVAPVYTILSIYQGFNNPVGRFVRPEVAKVLIFSIALAYLMPAIATLLHEGNTSSANAYLYTWRFIPVTFSILIAGFSVALSWWQRRPLAVRANSLEDSKPYLDRYQNADVPILKYAYQFAFATQMIAHITFLVYLWSICYTAIDTSNVGFLGFLKYNWAYLVLNSRLGGTILSALVFNMHCIWDFRRRGYVTTREAVRTALSVLAGQLIVGSGATWSALWIWREAVLSNLSTLIA